MMHHGPSAQGLVIKRPKFAKFDMSGGPSGQEQFQYFQELRKDTAKEAIDVDNFKGMRTPIDALISPQ